MDNASMWLSQCYTMPLCIIHMQRSGDQPILHLEINCSLTTSQRIANSSKVTDEHKSHSCMFPSEHRWPLRVLFTFGVTPIISTVNSSTSPEPVHIIPFDPPLQLKSQSDRSLIFKIYTSDEQRLASPPCSKIQLPNMLQDCHQRRNQKTSRTTWPGEPSDAFLITSTLSANPCFWCFRLTNCRVKCLIIKKRCNGYLAKTAWLKDRLQ